MEHVDKVVFEKALLPSGSAIGVATLNSEKTLNALDLEMIERLYEKLIAWQSDPDIVCVFLQGSGDKAFCAGGDVIRLYEASANYGEDLPSAAGQEFFTKEYRLDYLIHTYKKIIVVWGDGIIMGGGLGLISGASHRVVTERTRMSMPEVTIGLYPDVGATWFLSNMPEGVGEFLGLTGADMNAEDALFTGLADFCVSSDRKSDLLTALCKLDWSEDPTVDRVLVDRAIAKLSLPSTSKSNVEKNLTFIESLKKMPIQEKLQTIIEYAGPSEWLAKAAKKLKHGCPLSPFIVHEQIAQGKSMSLREVFKFELMLSSNALRLGHFKEGVRALLVDKDRQPRWNPASFSEVLREHIDEYFLSPWGEAAHPLEDL